MFLVTDIEVVINLLLLGLGETRIIELVLELALPQLNILVFLLNQLDKFLILVDEVVVLGQQQLDFFLEIIDLLVLADLEHQFLVNGDQFSFQLPCFGLPIFGFVGGGVV